MFFIISFFIIWVVWLVFADKKRWRELFLVGIFASLLGTATDNIIHHYKLWDFHSVYLFSLALDLFDDLSIYIVVPYLFIQWLPLEDKRNALNMFIYFFIWTAISITIEYVFLATNHMQHHGNWNLWHSYISDWVLFWIFYQFHKLFKLNMLSK